MERIKNGQIETAISRAIDTVAERAGVCAQTVRTEITQALGEAAKSGNARLQALEQANGAPLTPEDAVCAVLMLLALKEDVPTAVSKQNAGQN